MADLRGQQLKDSYQDVVTDSGSDLAGIENGNGADITGRVVSRGSNSNGEYVRFADGTQICWRNATITNTATNSESVDGITLYRSGTPTFSWPISFLATNYSTTIENRTQGTNGRLATQIKTREESLSVSEYEIQVVTLDSGGSDVNVSIQAIGRWK